MIKTSYCLSGILILGFSTVAVANDPVEVARRYRQENGAALLQSFAKMVSIPNVSSDLPSIERNAAYLKVEFQKRGVKVQLLRETGAAPIVYGYLQVAGAKRTLGIYAHYDGQPVDPAKWTHPPFEPVLYSKAIDQGGVKVSFPKPGEPIDPEWRMYARASGDDKAPIMAMLTALDALQSEDIALTSNIVFLLEGEEEIGSPHLSDYMDHHRKLFDAVDMWLICDGPAHQSRKPQLVFGVRGITGLDITVYGATRYLHSGHYGNWAPNPALMLAQLLASMKDDNGSVLVKDFYKSVTPAGDAERQAIAAMPDMDDALRKELGLARTEGNNAAYATRLLLPSLNIRGLSSATVGATARNVIPPTAQASLDIRLVKGNVPGAMIDLVEAHIRKQGFHIVRDDPDHQTRLQYPKIAKVTRHDGYPAARTAMDLPLAKQVIQAAQRVTGEPIIKLPTLGGSLPLYLFVDKLQKPAIIVPIANHDDNQHAPDENIQLANLWYGIDLMAALMTMPGA